MGQGWTFRSDIRQPEVWAWDHQKQPWKGKERQIKVSITDGISSCAARSTRKSVKRSRQQRSWERTCCIRSKRPRQICLHWMMSSCRPRLDWLFSRIISWQRSLSISQSKLNNCSSKITRWRARSRLLSEILRFTKRLRKNLLRGLISAKKLSKD